jgi:hypothetical protein
MLRSEGWFSRNKLINLDLINDEIWRHFCPFCPETLARVVLHSERLQKIYSVFAPIRGGQEGG